MRKIVVVLGAHRSGTSALAGALAEAGADCGKSLLPANEGNPKGYWELAPVVELNDRLLAALGHHWHDIAPLAGAWEDRPVVQCLREEATTLLSEQFDSSRVAVLKDPRLCLTMPFWRRVIEGLGWSLGIAVIARPVGEVIQSLGRRERLDGADIAYLWARSVLEAARAGLRPPALWVTYDQLLTAPSKVLERARMAFDVALDVPAQAHFVDTSLRHHADTPADDIPRELATLCEELYGAIRTAAENGSALDPARFRQHEAALAALDRVLLPNMMQQSYFKLRRAHEALIREKDAARVTVERQASELAAARANNVDLVNQVATARETIEALVSQIDDARRSHEARDRTEAELRNRVAGLLAEVEAARATIECQAAELQAARSAIQGLVAERDDARHVIERKELELGDASRAIGDLTQQIAAARSNIEMSTVEIDAARRTIDGLVAEVNAARATIHDLTRQIDDSRQAHAERERIERTLREQVAQLDAAARARRA